jgi:hypothetical protein
MKKYAALISIVVLFTVSNVKAAISPISVNIFPPVEFPPSSFSVTGLRVSVVGEQRNMYGIDLAAIGNITELEFRGLAVSGLFNMTHGDTTAIGLQAAAITNINTQKVHVVGVQFALVNSNVAESSIVGLEIGPIANLSPHTSIYGIQAGIYNKADAIYGFQIGLINMANSVHGLQIGLVNFNEKGLFTVCPILNFGF